LASVKLKAVWDNRYLGSYVFWFLSSEKNETLLLSSEKATKRLQSFVVQVDVSPDPWVEGSV
jgi:hypothetical protein